MHYFIFLDNYGLLLGIPAFSQNRESTFYFVNGDGNSTLDDRAAEAVSLKQINLDTDFSTLGLSAQDRVIFHFFDSEKLKQVYRKIREQFENLPILIVNTTEDESRVQLDEPDPCVNVVTTNSILRAKAQEKWHQIEIKRKLEKLKAAVDPNEPLFILTQNDPDPDAIASAMALQTILGRTDETAPIVTFKAVSRNENINMINILEAEVKEVTEEEINNARQIAMVDAQPSFFKRRFDNLVILIDHHPIAQDERLSYKDIQVTYGSTSTIVTEYLLANNTSISQKLATALYYGIKTDTFLLGREVSKADFNAFVTLWPKANNQQVARMERPRLNAEELDVYLKALKNHTLQNGFLFAELGLVPKDDLVPRLADFVLDIGNTTFAVVWGIVGELSTFSARSVTPVIDAGEVMREVFSPLGSAGGHKSMARANIPTGRLFKEFNTRSRSKLADLIRKRITRVVTNTRKSQKKGKD